MDDYNRMRHEREMGKEEGLQQGLKQGKKEGLVEGEAIGLVKGQAKALDQVALNMISMNLSNEQIQQATGLSNEQIYQLKKQNHTQ